MESFFRYVAYVDYLERGNRIHNAGFLRWKKLQGQHRIEIQVKDASRVTGSFPITEETAGKEIGYLRLDDGVGCFLAGFAEGRIDGMACLLLQDDVLTLRQVKGFRIDLGDGRMLHIPVELPLSEEETESRSEEESGDIREKSVDTRGESRDIPEENGDISEESENSREEGGDIRGVQEVKPNSLPDGGGNKSKQDEAPASVEMEAVVSENVLIDGLEEKVMMPQASPLSEDKWQQLCRQYPVVHPFPGGGEFLSIQPKDFVILRQGYQKLVHNSFLLHGYYNYRCMILGKLGEGEKAPYYLGVPGVYYERERQAAQMFGFAGFESTENPVQNGSYGYYMIEVEI
jgi:hypothetical protein